MQSMWQLLNIFLRFTIFLPMIDRCVSSKTPNISRVDLELREHVFSTASVHTRPIINQNKSIAVILGIEIVQIISVDERTQQVKFKLWTRISWKNEFSTWEPQKWSGIRSVKVGSEHVWTPDITLYNDIDDAQLAGKDKYMKDVKVDYDGTNTWNAPGIFKSICQMDVKFFPFDVQYCILKFGSWEYDAYELVLLKDENPVVTNKYIKSSEWDLVHVDVTINNIKYSCCSHEFQDMAFKFVIHRRPMYYVFNVIIPCIILMCLVLFSFFLPPDSGERITIVVTVLLAFTVILQMMNQSMPKNSDSAPVMLIFYVSIMAESTFSLITTCLVLVAHYRGCERWTAPLPEWVKNLSDKLSTPLGVYKSNTRKDFREHENLPSANGASYKCLARLMSDNNVPASDARNIVESITNVNVDVVQHHKLDKILQEIELITTQIKESEVQDQHELEWKQFARVLDRLFFLLILASFLISSIAILVPAHFRHQHEDMSLQFE